MTDRAGCHHLKPWMNVGIAPSGTARDQAPPDVMQWEVYMTCVVLLSETVNVNPVTSKQPDKPSLRPVTLDS